MPDEFARARYLVTVYERYFKIGGTWPLETGRMAYGKFTFSFVYAIVQYIMQWLYIAREVSDIRTAMPGLLETIWNTLVLPKMVIMRMSPRLSKLVIEILAEMNNKAFTTVGQRNRYLYYNEEAISFAKILIPCGVVGCITHFGASLIFLVTSALRSNGTIPIITPYLTYNIFGITSYYTLALFWIAEMFNMWGQIFYPTSLGFLVWLILHVSGQISALGYRIRNLDDELGINKEHAKAIFRSVARKHHNIQRMMNEINEIFDLIFLEEIFMSAGMVIIATYAVVVESDLVERRKIAENVTYAIIMLSLLYVPCLAGEKLLTESWNLREAYYNFRWYELPENYKKQFMICMIGAHRPLQLKGGGLFIFCLPSFVTVLKTAMSYLSVLRTMT